MAHGEVGDDLREPRHRDGLVGLACLLAGLGDLAAERVRAGLDAVNAHTVDGLLDARDVRCGLEALCGDERVQVANGEQVVVVPRDLATSAQRVGREGVVRQHALRGHLTRRAHAVHVVQDGVLGVGRLLAVEALAVHCHTEVLHVSLNVDGGGAHVVDDERVAAVRGGRGQRAGGNAQFSALAVGGDVGAGHTVLVNPHARQRRRRRHAGVLLAHPVRRGHRAAVVVKRGRQRREDGGVDDCDRGLARVRLVGGRCRDLDVAGKVRSQVALHGDGLAEAGGLGALLEHESEGDAERRRQADLAGAELRAGDTGLQVDGERHAVGERRELSTEYVRGFVVDGVTNLPATGQQVPVAVCVQELPRHVHVREQRRAGVEAGGDRHERAVREGVAGVERQVGHGAGGVHRRRRARDRGVRRTGQADGEAVRAGGGHREGQHTDAAVERCRRGLLQEGAVGGTRERVGEVVRSGLGHVAREVVAGHGDLERRAGRHGRGRRGRGCTGHREGHGGASGDDDNVALRGHGTGCGDKLVLAGRGELQQHAGDTVDVSRGDAGVRGVNAGGLHQRREGDRRAVDGLRIVEEDNAHVGVGRGQQHGANRGRGTEEREDS
eukprot:PhM_4_TR16766/c0_g2_i1/m.75047